MIKRKIVFLVGPTGIGKTSAAVILAKKINAEIVSCDSMQVYQGMDILTSKPSPAMRKKIPHHLIGVIPSESEFDVSLFRKESLKIIKGIFSRGKIPLFVGGTGMYMMILIDGIFDFKCANQDVRALLYKESEDWGSVYLFERLLKIDPEAARKIHPHDTKRIVRALEVFGVTGKPISELQKQRSGLAQKYDVRIVCLDMEREKLYRRIDARVDAMIERGLIKEIKALLKRTVSRTAGYAIGLKEFAGYCKGEYDFEEAVERMKQNTRRYAKRQLTWFRKDKRIKWVMLDEADDAKKISQKIYTMIKD